MGLSPGSSVGLILGTQSSGALACSPKIPPGRVFRSHFCWEGAFRPQAAPCPSACAFPAVSRSSLPPEIHTCSEQGREPTGRRDPHSRQRGKDPADGRSGNHQRSTGCWQAKGGLGDSRIHSSLASLASPHHACTSASHSRHGLGCLDPPCGYPGVNAAALFHCLHHPFQNKTLQVTLKPFPHPENGAGPWQTLGRPRRTHRNHTPQVSHCLLIAKKTRVWLERHAQMVNKRGEI